MKLNFKKPHMLGFYRAGDRIIFDDGCTCLVLRVTRSGEALTTDWKWWHWLIRWFL